MIEIKEASEKYKPELMDIGLRSPTEVLSTDYILKTEQNQYFLKISRLYFSPFIISLNFLCLGISSFLVLWSSISFPHTVQDNWFYIITSLLYFYISLEIVVKIYLWGYTLLNITSVLTVILAMTFIILSKILSENVSYFLEILAVLISFIFVIINISWMFWSHKLQRTTENDVHKMIEFDDIEDFKVKKSVITTENEDKKLVIIN